MKKFLFAAVLLSVIVWAVSGLDAGIFRHRMTLPPCCPEPLSQPLAIIIPGDYYEFEKRATVQNVSSLVLDLQTTVKSVAPKYTDALKTAVKNAKLSDEEQKQILDKIEAANKTRNDELLKKLGTIGVTGKIDYDLDEPYVILAGTKTTIRKLSLEGVKFLPENSALFETRNDLKGYKERYEKLREEVRKLNIQVKD